MIRRYPEDFLEGVMEKPANDRDYADILIEDLQYPADRDKKRYDKYCRAFSLYFKGGKTVSETARLMHASGKGTYYTLCSGMRTLRGNHREAGVPSTSEEYLRFRQEPGKTYEEHTRQKWLSMRTDLFFLDTMLSIPGLSAGTRKILCLTKNIETAGG